MIARFSNVAGGDRRAFARTIALLAAGLLAALVTVAGVLPASFADVAIDRATHGRIRLAETEGSFWQGSARLIFSDGNPVTRGVVTGLVLPGRVRWDVRSLPLLLGLVQADLSLAGMAQPLSLSGAFGELRLGAGALDLPPIELERLGSPWNTIRPVAGIALRWEPLTIREGSLQGKASIELRDVASAITSVRPLGTYRVDAVSSGGAAQLSIQTLSGPLKLEGQGSWNSAQGLRFSAQASAEESEQSRLQPVLALIGRLEANRTVIRIGE